MKCPHCGHGISNVVCTFTIAFDSVDRVEKTPILLVACSGCDKVLGVVNATPKALGTPQRD